MKSRIVSDDAASRIRVVVLDSGEEAFAELTRFANDAGVAAASLTSIGAFEKATVGWFDFANKTYKKIEVNEQCEVLSAIGDIATGDDAMPVCTCTSCSGCRTVRPAGAICSRER
jgi:hypothetical protein